MGRAISLLCRCCCIVSVVYGGAANASVIWSANYSGLDVTNWARLDCGGTGGTCACKANANYLAPVGPTADYGPGRCNPPTDTLSNHSMPNPESPGASARLQFVPDPKAGLSGNVLRVKAARGDAFFDCSSATTRVEMSTPSGFGSFHPGDDYYFAVSMYFPSAYFGQYLCNSDTVPPDSYDCSQCPQPSNCQFSQLQNHGGCAGGTVGTDSTYGPYSAWNVVTQWHAPGFPSMGFSLQRLYEDTSHQYYQLSFASMITNPPTSGHSAGGLWHDAGDPSKGGAIWTDRWYHFVVHVVFGATPYPGSGSPSNNPANGNVNGYVELWESIDSVPGKTSLTLQSFNGAALRVARRTARAVAIATARVRPPPTNSAALAGSRAATALPKAWCAFKALAK